MVETSSFLNLVEEALKNYAAATNESEQENSRIQLQTLLKTYRDSCKESSRIRLFALGLIHDAVAWTHISYNKEMLSCVSDNVRKCLSEEFQDDDFVEIRKSFVKANFHVGPVLDE